MIIRNLIWSVLITLSIIICHVHPSLAESEFTDGCIGLAKKNEVGTECTNRELIESCSNLFANGATIKFKCGKSYKPKRNSVSGSPTMVSSNAENQIQVSTCLGNNEWSNSEFPSFQCEREHNAYCNDGWANFWDTYNTAHNSVMMFVYVIGIVTNSINLLVLTRRKMINPLNTILAMIAFTDFLFLSSGLIKNSMSFYWKNHGDTRSSYHKALGFLLYQIAYYLSHAWSIYLTLLVASWRLFGIMRPLESRVWQTQKIANWAIFGVFMFTSFFIFPLMYGGARIEKIEGGSSEGNNGGAQDNEIPHYELKFGETGIKFLYWIYAIFEKLLPSILLTIFTGGLIKSLFGIKKKRFQLMHDPALESQSITPQNVEFDRTTKMLLVILIIFLVTEIPDAVVVILVLTTPKAHTDECLVPIVDFMIFLEHFSAVSTLFVYLTMSEAFRTTFLKTFSISKDDTKKQSSTEMTPLEEEKVATWDKK